MPERLAGRVAVVTGGGAGIGAAICQRLVQEGAQVLVADIDGDAAAQVAQGLNGSMACQVRISQALSVQMVFLTAGCTFTGRRVRRNPGERPCDTGCGLGWQD